MNDYRLKPRLLRSVVRDRLPDEKRVFPSPAELATVLSHVRDLGLLSERHSDFTNHKLSESWSAALDSWVERIVSLSSSNATDKCWAGTSLLGLTCEECCSGRFQSSYPIWFQRLLENLQSLSASHIVKVACCASLNDLFTRLSCFPNLKKDGALFSGKLILHILQLLNEDTGGTVSEVAVSLLCTLLSFFPSSLQRYYDNVETILASKIIASKCNLNMSKKFAKCLSLLPNVKGDDASWCLIIQKILIAINAILTDAFQGLEEEKKSFEVMKVIVPLGKEPPPPLGGQTLLLESSDSAIKRIRELLVPRVTTLMDSICIMLSNPYPLPVLIPVRSLLSTVWRVLQVDGTFHESMSTSMHQELLCAVLPALHLGSLNLLIAIIKSLRSQFLPHAANAVQLLTDYFQRAQIPSTRIKVYSIVQMLLISMGVGMTLYLAQDVISSASADLSDYLGHGSSSMNSNKQSPIVVGEALQQNHRRKRKRASVMLLDHPNGADLSIKTTYKNPQTPLSLQIAALKALEALLTVGGSLRSERWRADVDRLVITVATNACDAGWANEVNLSLTGDESVSFADFQLATLEVLLVSLLSPTQSRPPYLSQGLHLFCRGRQETGTKLAAFCANALLALEVLIHPRALPLADHPPPLNPSFNERFCGRIGGINLNNGIKSKMPFFPKDDLDLLDEDEELSNTWFDKNDEQNCEDMNLNGKHTETATQPSRTEAISENPSSANVECENKVSQNVAAEMDCASREGDIADRERREKFWPRNEIILNNEFAQERSPISLDRSGSPFSASLSNHGNVATNLTAGEDGVAPKKAADFEKIKAANSPYDSDLDSLPEIVFADPDTDSSI